MKGQSKRFVDHKGEAYETHTNKDEEEVKTDEDIGFLDLWRYATPGEKAMTALGVLVSLSCSLGVLAAVIIYGELTALFVQRHRAESTPAAFILPLFGGARQLPEGNRSLHMDALVEDSVSFALASLAVMALQLAAASGAVTLANAAANRMVRRLRWQLLRAVLSQEIAFFDTNTTVNFATALTEDMEKFRAGVGEHVVMTSYLGGTVAFGAGLSLAYGWELTLVGLAVVPIAIFVAVTVAKYQTRCSAKEMSAYSAAGSVVEETLSAIRTVRAYGGEELEVQRYAQALGAAGLAARRRGAWAGLGAGLGWLLTYCINASVLAYGAVLCVRDMALPPADQLYHPGVLVTVLFMTFMAAQNIAMCHPHLEVLSAARGAARALYAVLRRRPRLRSPTPSPTAPAAFRGDIVFDNLYFNYPSRPDVKVLRGLSLRVKAGETVALVGSSGCGKSTLLQLLQRLYDPDSGTVSIDGYPLEELNLHHYRTSIGVVGQEPVLFSGTIRENITIGVDDVTEEEMIAAAKTAYAHQFITKLADGYDTVLGEHGAQLSGGQKQRVAIARAVLRRPAVLLLDEPTSALDPAAERQVQAALDAASRGRTTLVVSHRLSTIVNASRIVYMEHGAALEQGTHTELLALRGLYWQLVQEDMTNRSVAALSAAPIAEEDDVVPRSDPREHLQRSFSRQSNCSVSLTRDSVIRGSARHGSVSSAHANIGTSHLINHQEPVDPPEAETEEQSQVPAVSTMELLRLNAKEWPLLAGGGAASFLVGATMPVFALLFSKIYGMFASSDGAEILAQSQLYAALFAGVAALCGAVTFLQTFLFNRAGASLTDRLRQLTFRNYLRQDQGWFDDQQNSVGALCARLATDCAAVQGATGTPLGTILQSVSTVVIGVGLAMPYSWKMTLVSLVSVPCVMGGIYLEGWVTRRCSRLAARALEAAAGRAGEAVRAVRTVQSLGVEATMLARYGAALDAAERATLGARWGRGAAYGVCLCAPTLGYAVSLAYGGLLVAREGLPYEHAILVSEALIYGAWMLAEALSFAPSFAAARRAGARIVQALALQPRVYSDPSARCEPDWSPKGELDFSDISFRYPTRPDTQILRGLQLHLEAGKTVALVGASGCGKSTVMHLLMRSYDPESGTVSLDGRDIRRSLPLAALRGALGVVQQEPALFARSVRDNIAYGDPARRVPTDEVVLAAKQANVHNFIASLPLGYDTPLGGAGGGGGALSGGQRQRIAIARALVRRPRVLLLDEATSALDASSEKSVQAALEAASRGRSTLTIAHRLATVRHAHTIAVIDKGVVAESGSHEELVERRGLYWELLRQQGAQPAQ